MGFSSVSTGASAVLHLAGSELCLESGLAKARLHRLLALEAREVSETQYPPHWRGKFILTIGAARRIKEDDLSTVPAQEALP